MVVTSNVGAVIARGKARKAAATKKRQVAQAFRRIDEIRQSIGQEKIVSGTPAPADIGEGQTVTDVTGATFRKQGTVLIKTGTETLVTRNVSPTGQKVETVKDDQGRYVVKLFDAGGNLRQKKVFGKGSSPFDTGQLARRSEAFKKFVLRTGTRPASLGGGELSTRERQVLERSIKKAPAPRLPPRVKKTTASELQTFKGIRRGTLPRSALSARAFERISKEQKVKLLSPAQQRIQFEKEKERIKKGLPGKVRLTRLEQRALALSGREFKIEKTADKILNFVGLGKKVSQAEIILTSTSAFPAQRKFFVEFLKEVAGLPVNLVSGFLIVGGRAAMTAEALYKREKTDVLRDTLKKTPKAILQSFDPRTPSGFLNIIMTVGFIKSIKTNAAKKIQFNKQLQTLQTKGVKARVLTKKISGGRTQITKRGTIKIGEKTIPFEEIIIKKTSKVRPSDFTAKTITRFKVGEKSFRTIRGKIKKGVQVVEKPLPRTRVKATVKIKGKLRVGRFGRRIKQEFGAIARGKDIIKVIKSKWGQKIIRGKISNVKNPLKETTTFDLELIQFSLPRQTYLKLLRNSLRNIGKTIKTRRLSKSQLAKLSNKASLIKKTLRKPFKTKKGQLAMGRPKTGLETGFELLGKKGDISAADRIIATAQKKLKAISEKPSITKPKPQARVTKTRQKVRITKEAKILEINPDTVIPGARLLLEPRIIVLAPTVPSIRTRISAITGAKPQAIARTRAITEAIPEGVSEVIPNINTLPTPQVIPGTATTPGTGFGSFFTPGTGLTTVLTPAFVPFIGGLPIPLPKGGGVFAFGVGTLARNRQLVFAPDLYSRIYGERATLDEARSLLRVGRTFTGAEIRKIVPPRIFEKVLREQGIVLR